MTDEFRFDDEQTTPIVVTMVPAIPSVADLEEQEHERAAVVVETLTAALMFLDALAEEVQNIDTSGQTFRGLGAARVAYPLIEKIMERAGAIKTQALRAIEMHLRATNAGGTVLGGRSYDFKAKPGSYVYQAPKVREVLERFVGVVFSKEEIAKAVVVTLVPELVIPAHEETVVSGVALAALLRKHGKTLVRVADEERTIDSLVSAFRTRDEGTARLVPASR